ncbi:RNase P and RNase MRP subunit [Chytriomyces hyalinus]|nr:RNase P and RNase MRP subunit [Chytriomyces hyalinus]
MGNKSKKIVAAKGHGQQTHNTQKTILDNPLVYKWPSLDPQDAALILSTLTSIIAPIGEKRSRAAAARSETTAAIVIQKQKAQQSAELQQTQSKLDAVDADSLDINARIQLQEERKKLEKKLKRKAAVTAEESSVTVNPAPKRKRVDLEATEESVANDQHLALIWKSLAIGVNTVTNCLSTRNVANPDRKCLNLSMVFVCKADVAAAHLFAHLPTMCYLAGEDVILVPLPAGSEKALSNCLGLKSVIALGVQADSPNFQELYELVKKIVGPPRIPWMWRPSKTRMSSVTATDSANAGETAETAPTIPPITAATALPIKSDISYHPTNLKTLNIVQGKQSGNGGRVMPAGGASKGKKASKSSANDKK